MPWVNPSTVIAGAVLNATKWNQDVVANTEFLARPPSVSLTRSSAQSLPSGANRSVAWVAEQWDTDTMWSSTAPTRIDINTAGKYRVEANLGWFFTASTNSRPQLGVYAGAVGSSTSAATSILTETQMRTGLNNWYSNGSVTLSLTSTSTIRIVTASLGSTGSLLTGRVTVMWVSS